MGSIPRYRMRSGLSAAASFPEQSIYTSCSHTAWSDTGWSGAGIPLGSTESMSDVVVENFNKRRKAHEVFFNPMRHEKRAFSTGGGSGAVVRNLTPSCKTPLRRREYKVDGDAFQYYAAFSTNSDHEVGDELTIRSLYSGEEMNNLIVEVSTALRNKRGRPSNNGNLAETAMELNKSLGMLSSLAQSIRKVVERKSSILARAQGVAGSYLLYRYGMRPLVSDITNIALAMETQAKNVRETTRSFLKDDRYTAEGLVVYGQAANRHINVGTSDVINVRAMSLDEFRVDRLYASGFSLKGLLTLPYEAIPLSFVADWFTNFGDYLGAYAPTPSFLQLGSCVTFERETTTSYTAGLTVANAGWEVVRSMTGSVKGVRHIKERMPLPAPGLVIRNDFGLSNLPRALDAVSLLVQRIKAV